MKVIVTDLKSRLGIMLAAAAHVVDRVEGEPEDQAPLTPANARAVARVRLLVIQVTRSEPFTGLEGHLHIL